MQRIVIIAGSAEAQALAQRLGAVQVLLPHGMRGPGVWPAGAEPVPIARAEGCIARADAVIEAAHPCDVATARLVATLCARNAVPHLQLVRPVWRPARLDRWVRLRDASLAPRVIPDVARVLVTTGRAELAALRSARFTALVRRIGAADGPMPLRRGRWLTGQGPFTPAEEMRLMRKERVDWLLLRNAGGAGGWPKLAAARALGLPVAMIDRPARPHGPRVHSIEEALTWLSQR